MEYLLNKIYSDPIFSIKNLSTFQLNYFYDYFKCEYLSEDLSSSPEGYDDSDDKEIAFRIYKNIKLELKQRVPLGVNYRQLH